MKIRVWTTMNYIDVELKEKIDMESLVKAIDNQDSILLNTKDNTTLVINNLNVVAIEILEMPPISKK